MGGKSLPKERVTVHAGGKSFVIDNFKSVESYGNKESKNKPLMQEKGFKEEINAFVDSVKTGKNAISFKSTVNTTLTTFAIEESIKTGKVIFIKDLEKKI